MFRWAEMTRNAKRIAALALAFAFLRRLPRGRSHIDLGIAALKAAPLLIRQAQSRRKVKHH
ncbi:MAG: hypothetical protein ACI915_003879 [Gammaproteobacteria bacterium]|jgi:hypothetical protein